jgi:hypothetical protein
MTDFPSLYKSKTFISNTLNPTQMKKPEIIKFCAFCKDQFIASKPSATYCSNSCRTKANNQRRENEKNEAETARIQAEIDQAKHEAKEARKLKKANKVAELADAKHLADIELEIQAEIKAYELSEKNRGINSIVGMLLVNAEARETKCLVKDELKKQMNKIKLDSEMKKKRERDEEIIKAIIEMFNNPGTPNKEPDNTSKKQNDIIQPHQPQEPGDSLFPEKPNSTNAELKSNDLPSLEGMNRPGSSNRQVVTPHNENIKPAPPNNEPGKVNIAGNIIDMITSFFK